MKYFFLFVNTFFWGWILGELLLSLYGLVIIKNFPCVFPICERIQYSYPVSLASIGTSLYIPVVMNWLIYLISFAVSFLFVKKFLITHRLIALSITTIIIFFLLFVYISQFYYQPEGLEIFIRNFQHPYGVTISYI